MSPASSATVLSLCMRDGLPPAGARLLSVGIHPWYLSDGDLQQQMRWLEMMADDGRVIAIGEAGLDRRCGTPLELQLTAFKFVVGVAESHRLPLVVHCVKAASDIVGLKRALSPSQPWIMHGFRGKPELAESLLRHGFFLSFGERFNVEALKLTPLDRLFLETDECASGIGDIYNKVAAVRGIPQLCLEAAVAENLRLVFRL